jgi:hypothetical protein
MGHQAGSADESPGLSKSNTAVASVVGLGYVGLPLAAEGAQSAFRAIGTDLSAAAVPRVSKGESQVHGVAAELVHPSTAKACCPPPPDCLARGGVSGSGGLSITRDVVRNGAKAVYD